ncbi:MAG: radical SAM protein [Candidatus Sericytochromatia bacterium]
MPAASAVRVGLAQVNAPAEFLVYLPYSVALLQAYAQAHAPDPSRYDFLLPQFQRKRVELAAAELAGADIVGFSCYVWNNTYHLSLAKALKQQHPEILIVFGGPHVPDAPGDFLTSHPFVDVCVHGEGEATFLRLLEAWPGNQWSDIPGISYRGADGACITQPRAPRIQELDAIPSPYLTGVFDALMQRYPDLVWAGIWESNRGCPFSCSFCDWGSAIASKVHRFGMERLAQEIDWFGRHRIGFLFCADANFGILPRDLELAELIAASKARYGFPQKLVTAMTKNQPDRAFESIRILHEAGLLIGATLSFQAVSPTVLQAIRRDNISLPVYQQLLRRFVGHGIPTYTDILIGLPEESFDSFLDGLDALITMGQHDEMRFLHTYLLPNAEMSAPEYRRRYGLETITLPFFSSHLELLNVEEVAEEYEMVVATNTLPREDWIRARALAWLIELLYYSKLLQLPLLLIHALTGLTHRELLLAFFETPLPARMPLLHKLRHFLHAKARTVSQGEPESCLRSNPLTGESLCVPVPAFVLTHLLFGAQLGDFLQESRQLLKTLLQSKGLSLPPGLLTESLTLAAAMLETSLPQKRPVSLDLSYNLWSCYQQIRQGQEAKLEAGAWRLIDDPAGTGYYAFQEVSRTPQSV